MNQIFYHGSFKQFRTGQTLVPQKDGYVQISLSDHGFEDLVEQLRPNTSISRLSCVFMSDDPDLIDPAGGSTDAIYRVNPIGEAQKSDLAWYTEAFEKYTEEGASARVQDLIRQYWKGTPYHQEENSCFEYRALSATVTALYELNVEESDLFSTGIQKNVKNPEAEFPSL